MNKVFFLIIFFFVIGSLRAQVVGRNDGEIWVLSKSNTCKNAAASVYDSSGIFLTKRLLIDTARVAIPVPQGKYWVEIECSESKKYRYRVIVEPKN